jgi:hypothetical protein
MAIGDDATTLAAMKTLTRLMVGRGAAGAAGSAEAAHGHTFGPHTSELATATRTVAEDATAGQDVDSAAAALLANFDARYAPHGGG